MSFLWNIVQKASLQIIKKKNWFNLLLATTDLFIILITFQISYNIKTQQYLLLFITNRDFLLLFLYMIPAWILLFQVCNLAQIPRTSRKSRLFLEFMQFTVINILVIFLYRFVLQLNNISNSFIFLFASLILIALYLIRIIEYKILKKYRADGYNSINIILIADGSSLQFIEELINRKEWGYRILLVFSDSNLVKNYFGDRLKILPRKSVTTLKNLMEVDIVDEVFYINHTLNGSEIRETIRLCEEVGVVFRLRAEYIPAYLTNGKFSQIGETQFFTYAKIPTNSMALSFKTAMDVYLSFLLILLSAPFMLIIALIIYIDSPGPVFFKQARVGLRGRQFYLYKFRTMVPNAEKLKKELETKNEMDGPVFKIKKDPRITSFGRILRKTGLDELPQLFNVIKGEMSLIGPRPPLQSETRYYKRWQLRRLSVKPGISCSWQIMPDRNSIKFDNWMKLDLAYIDNWSPALDLKILVKTISTVVFKTGV